MAATLPYLSSYKNVEALFSTIASAKIPEKFTHSYLYKTIGLKGTNDRALIPLLRTLGFIDNSGSPTAAYRLLKNKAAAKKAIGSAVRKAYLPLFEANENAHSLQSEQLKGLIAQTAGTDDDMTARIAQTFSALVRLGDFSESDEVPEQPDDETERDDDKPPKKDAENAKPMRPEFHYNIQIHLPSNATEKTYLDIFNAVRRAFQ